MSMHRIVYHEAIGAIPHDGLAAMLACLYDQQLAILYSVMYAFHAFAFAAAILPVCLCALLQA
jgi:hypothetical protein